MNVFAAITKYDEEQGLVYGYASTEALDSQGEVVKREAIADSLDDYMKWANLREMHTASAVGVVNEATMDEKGLYIVGKVVDADARLKCKEGVYKGFSIGGKSLTKSDGVISRLSLTEISLVDRPANPECKIDMYKMDRDGEVEHVEDTPAPAADEAKADEAVDVKKGMYTVAWLAGLVDQLNDIKASAEWEAQAEGDSSPIPEQLRAAVNNLSAILVDMTREETAELTEGTGDLDAITMAAEADDVEKAGKAISAANMTKIQAAHDAMVTLGASCGSDSDKAAHADDIAKMAAANDTIAKLELEKADLQKQVVELDEAVRKLLAQPAPMKGALRVVEKGQEITLGDETAREVAPVVVADAEKADLATQIKKIHAQGGQRVLP